MKINLILLAIYIESTKLIILVLFYETKLTSAVCERRISKSLVILVL